VAQADDPINEVSGGAVPVYLTDPAYFQSSRKTITPIGGNLSGS